MCKLKKKTIYKIYSRHKNVKMLNSSSTCTFFVRIYYTCISPITVSHTSKQSNLVYMKIKTKISIRSMHHNHLLYVFILSIWINILHRQNQHKRKIAIYKCSKNNQPTNKYTKNKYFGHLTNYKTK